METEKRSRNHEDKRLYKRHKSKSCKANGEVDGNDVVDGNAEVDGNNQVERKLKPGFGFSLATRQLRNRCEKSNYYTLYNHTICPANDPAVNQRTECPTTLNTTPITKLQEHLNCDTPSTHPFVPRNGRLSINLFASRTYPPSSKSPKRHSRPKSSSSELSQDTDLEQDTIIPQQVTQKKLLCQPSDVPDAFVDITKRPPYEHWNWFTVSIRKEKPDELTNIIIPHDYATDTEAGDFFGAKIATYRTYDKKTARTFNQHFFVDVDLHGPADKMKIENWDELLIVGDTFVPVLSHTDVLNVFHRVKVDGLTRFVMVIRRVSKHRITPVTWHWYETSAVLAPDKHEKGETKVQKLEYKPLENNRYEMKYLFRFKITFTPNYLDIKASGITVGPLFNDAHQNMTKNIWQTAILHEDGDSKIPIYSCTLCDHNQKVFLSLDEHSNVVASNTQKWFEYQLIGRHIFFKDRDQQTYLAFDNGENKLTTKSTQYTFERFGPQGKDEVDMVDSASSVNGSHRRSDDGAKRIAGFQSQRSSGYGSQESSFDKTSDTEMSACDTKLLSTNSCLVERSYANGSTNRMTRSMSRQLSDVRGGVLNMSV